MQACWLQASRDADRKVPLEKFPKEPPQSTRDASERAGAHRHARRVADGISKCIQRQTDAGGERRTVHVIRKSADARRTAAPDREVEDLLRDLRHPVENRAAAGQNDTRVEAFLIPSTANFVPDQMEN